MKNFTLFSLVVTSLLFTACDQKTEKATEEKVVAVQETVEKKTTTAMEDAKSAFNKAAEATKAKAAELAEATAKKTVELKASAEESMNEASAVVKEKTEAIKVAASEAMATLTAPAAYGKCKGCHGVEGKTKALGKSAVIAGQDKALLIASLQAYKAGTKNEVGMGSLMKGQVVSMNDADFEAIAEYLSAIK